MHELQRAFVHYIVVCPLCTHYKRTIVNDIVNENECEKSAWRLWFAKERQRCTNIRRCSFYVIEKQIQWCEIGSHHQWRWWKAILIWTVKRWNDVHWLRREILVQRFGLIKEQLSLNEKWKKDSIYTGILRFPRVEKYVKMIITDKLVMPYYDARRILLKKCFMTCMISICMINYAIPVKSAL